MKSIWSGALYFGLVNIPVKLFSAVKEHSFGFTLLCKTCHQPIHYKRWCNHCKKEIAWNDVVKGLKVDTDHYIILTPEKIKSLKPEKYDTINISEFVPTSQIPPIYYEHHYYIMPSDMHKAYFLFARALGEMNQAAIGQFVMREKEHVCAIQPYGQGLLLSTLNYAYEIQPIKFTSTAKKEKFNQHEVALATQLIKQLAQKKFDISDFKDSFIEKLKKAINKKKKEPIKRKMAKKETRKAHVPKTAHSLITTLKESLKESRVH